ncbi:hypothetical protein E0H35_29665 [Rhizobium leguminosarum bv. viciae]|nr:hypothetical protein [Rhizobium leguminosarum bv. viciae]TBY91342.1 hypothetical protein E0H35_29665 [Rhizobium leguminosarum bv. viciae]
MPAFFVGKSRFAWPRATDVRFARIAAPHPNPLPVLTGRGDVPYETRERDEEGAACPFAPFTGRRCRQADEGLPSAISWAEVRAPVPTLIASARPGDPFEGRRFRNPEIQLMADRLGAFERCQH